MRDRGLFSRRLRNHRAREPAAGVLCPYQQATRCNCGRSRFAKTKIESDLMRPDMAKVIVERPRHGSGLPTKGKGYERRFARIAWEDQPKREGIKWRSGGAKHLNEH